MKKGFTMIELLGVIVISCILILIAVPIYNGIKKSINESLYESKIKEVLSKSEVYKEETNKYFFDIKTLIEEGYLTADNELEEYIDPRNGRNMVCDIIIVKDQEEIEIRKSEICYTKEELESIYGYVKLIVTDEKGTSLESTKEWYKKEKVWIRYLIQKENIEVEEIHWSGEEEKICTKEDLSACEAYEIETSSVKNVIVRLNAKLKQKENEIESTVTKEINLDIQRPRVIEGSINIENEIRTDGKKKVNFELTDGSGSGVKEYAVVKEKSCNGKEFEENRKSAKDKVQTEYLSNGDYYICVEDEVGNRTTESDLENENNKIHVENVDEGAPVIKKFEATSTNATYKAITTNLSIEATDDGGTNNLKMCISNTGYLKDCSWEKYNTNKNNWNVGGNLDGIERTIYLSIQDSTGKIANRQAKYTPYKEGSMTNKVYKGEWSNCSKACGGGIKTREYQIKDKYTNKVISSGQDKESCNTKSCDYNPPTFQVKQANTWIKEDDIVVTITDESGVSLYAWTNIKKEPSSWETANEKEKMLVNKTLTSNQTIYLWAKDSAGNTSFIEIVETKIDNVEPKVNYQEPDYDDFTNQMRTVTLSATDDKSGIKAIYYSLMDYSNFKEYTSPFSTTAPFLYVYAVDNAGNKSRPMLCYTNIDTASPFTPYLDIKKTEEEILNKEVSCIKNEETAEYQNECTIKSIQKNVMYWFEAYDNPYVENSDFSGIAKWKREVYVNNRKVNTQTINAWEVFSTYNVNTSNYYVLIYAIDYAGNQSRSPLKINLIF